MGKLIIGVVIGLVVGLGGAVLMGGAMMGVGAGAGLSVGICSVVEAANETGALTPEQIDELLVAAAGSLSDKPIAEGTNIAGSAAQCEQVMRDLRDAG